MSFSCSSSDFFRLRTMIIIISQGGEGGARKGVLFVLHVCGVVVRCG